MAEIALLAGLFGGGVLLGIFSKPFAASGKAALAAALVPALGFALMPVFC